MNFNIPLPNILIRNRVKRKNLHRGDVVAFRIREAYQCRIGIIVMSDNKKIMMAVDLNSENNAMCYDVFLSYDIELYEASEEEILWGRKFFLVHEYSKTGHIDDLNIFLDFIDHESPSNDCGNYVKEKFCKRFLSTVPDMLEPSEQAKLKNLVMERILQSGGLQFNRYQTEFLCFLTGVLMITEKCDSVMKRRSLIDQLNKQWHHLTWMYGMVIGRVLGSKFPNFTAVTRQLEFCERSNYLHLYLPLIENNLDKISKVAGNRRKKLQAAINYMREKEALEEQKSDLDELYSIIFPQNFQLAMLNSRPATTIADLRKEVAEKDQRIKKLENDIDGMTNKYNHVLEQLTKAVDDVETDMISSKDLVAAFLRFPTELALMFFGSIATLLAMNPTWQKYAPQIQEQMLTKQKEQPQNQFIVYPQAGSTANLGCQMQSPEFKILPGGASQPTLDNRELTHH